MDKGQIFETGRLMSLVVDEHGHNRLLEKITVMEEKGRAFVEGERLSEQCKCLSWFLCSRVPPQERGVMMLTRWFCCPSGAGDGVA